jgi:predicted Fe-Mo cluster-binding NifX family protein
MIGRVKSTFYRHAFFPMSPCGEVAMRIAITAIGKGSDAEVDLRCERACYILIFSSDGDLIETIDNRRNVYATHSPTGEVSQLLARKNVEVILTGPCGLKSRQAMNNAGIEVVFEYARPVSEALGTFIGRVQLR